MVGLFGCCAVPRCVERGARGCGVGSRACWMSMWAWLVPVERSVVSKRASYCRVSAGTSLLIRPLCLPRPLPQATDHARQLIEKYVGKPFFDLPYARGELRVGGWLANTACRPDACSWPNRGCHTLLCPHAMAAGCCFACARVRPSAAHPCSTTHTAPPLRCAAHERAGAGRGAGLDR